MRNLAKARTLLGKYEAITNAAEMIRSHGEEGFCFVDKEFDKVYKREAKKLCEKLIKMAAKYKQEYDILGLDINTEIDEEDY